MVPGAGVEPAQCFHRGILSPMPCPLQSTTYKALTNAYGL
jgi:hypothetical protein